MAVGALCVATAANADPGSIASKQAQAQQVLSQISSIDHSLDVAVEQYNLANVRLQKIEGDMRENKKQLTLARANLKVSQKSLAKRLVTAYTSTEDTSTLAVLLGATSFEDMLNRVEAINSTSTQDANIVQQVRSSKLAIQHHEVELREAHTQQRTIVAQKAAQREHIQSQLATRRQLLSSIRGQIQQMKAAEAAQQRRLEQAAQARVAGHQSAPTVSGVGVGASTPEGSTVAPPNVHGGVVGIAMHYLGVPYVWGGASPRGFDCSGFVMYVYAQIGVSLPHSTYAMMGMGTAVSISQLQPGDLVFFSGASHMGIYIGGGQFIHAPHTGDFVKISSLSGYYSSAFYAARRI